MKYYKVCITNDIKKKHEIQMNGASNAYEATRILINPIFNLDFRIVRIYYRRFVCR